MEKLSIIVPVFIDCQELYDSFLDSLITYNTSVQSKLFLIINKLVFDEKKFYEDVYTNLPINIEFEIINEGERSVAGSWNKGISLGKDYGAEKHLILNQDIKLFSNTIADLMSKIDEYDLLSGDSHLDNTSRELHIGLHFSCILIKDSTIDKIGYFDKEYKPCYYEDNDYFTRGILGGLKMGNYNKAKFYHATSLVKRKSPDRAHHINHWFGLNEHRFRSKWGTFSDRIDDIQNKFFKTPYNSGKGLDWWPETDKENYRVDGLIHE